MRLAWITDHKGRSQQSLCVVLLKFYSSEVYSMVPVGSIIIVHEVVNTVPDTSSLVESGWTT